MTPTLGGATKLRETLSARIDCNQCQIDSANLFCSSQIIDAVAARNMSGTILLSADAHWSAVNRVRKGLYEFVLSPLGAFSALSSERGKTEPELAFLYGTSYISDITVRLSLSIIHFSI
jgi:hypothetical protein